MPTKVPKEALFDTPVTADSLGGDDHYGRLVACAALHGLPVQAMAERAAVTELAARMALSLEDAHALLRALQETENPR